MSAPPKTGDGPTVLDLLAGPDIRRGLFPAGRLDKDTVGLLILTNDGASAHRWLSPKRHVEKRYFFRCARPLDEAAIAALERGVDIGGLLTKPAHLTAEIGGTEGKITITEGKFHQIKRMFTAVGNGITFLERICFAGLPLDPALPRGGYRRLTDTEIRKLINPK